jgi:hypothetical protein
LQAPVYNSRHVSRAARIEQIPPQGMCTEARNSPRSPQAWACVHSPLTMGGI